MEFDQQQVTPNCVVRLLEVHESGHQHTVGGKSVVSSHGQTRQAVENRVQLPETRLVAGQQTALQDAGGETGMDHALQQLAHHRRKADWAKPVGSAVALALRQRPHVGALPEPG